MDLRLFIALELPDTFIASLEKDLRDLKRSHPEFRWTGRENQHLTLAFLGSVPEQGVPLVTKALEQSVLKSKKDRRTLDDTYQQQTISTESINGIEIAAQGIYTFPPRKPASVLAVGLGAGSEAVSLLAAHLERELLAIKDTASLKDFEASQRPFTPHITVARAGKSPIQLEAEERQVRLTARGIVCSVALVSSVLQRGGPVYTVQNRVSLEN
ncbi:RNA 2',3'-cyclic phosphodiesterase [Gracilinema caldarium]|uniref:RNA 2',3'-cyclic phosphodiesterase n=1 Tax=Gracilinema caldarium TaxID=215591 RepID=UPI0026EF0B79|nr:RNA 2',3'-cyclic phosphodiesterase [Gracilinema caldarium]